MKRFNLLLVWVILIIGCVSFFYGLDKTSLRFDEARIGGATLRFIQGTDKILDTKALPHESPLIGYFLIPALYLLGNTLLGLKITLALFYFITLIGTYFLCMELYKKEEIAVIALASFLASSLVIEFSKNQWELSPIPLATTFFLLFFFRFIRTGKSTDLVLLAGFLSLGIAIKLIFIYFVAAFGFSLVLFDAEKRDLFIKKLRCVNIGTLSTSLLLFIVFQLPFIYKSSLATGSNRFGDFVVTAIITSSHSNLVQSILVKLHDFLIFSPLFLITLVYLLVCRKEKLFTSTCLAIAPLLIFTPNVPHDYHYLVLIPIPFILMGVFLTDTRRFFRVKNVKLWLIIILIVTLAIGMSNYVKVFEKMKRSNQLGVNIRPFFMKIPPQKLVTSDSYVFDLIQFVTDNRFNMKDFNIYDGPNEYQKVYNESYEIIVNFIDNPQLRYFVFGRLESNNLHGYLKEKVFNNISFYYNISYKVYNFDNQIIVYEKV